MTPKLEYIVLISLALIFYFYVLKDDMKKKRDKKFVKNNLAKGCKIITESKIIGEVIEFDEVECLIITGKEDKFSYILVKLDSIEAIIEA